jgi:para-nitrobenzyl esterase
MVMGNTHDETRAFIDPNGPKAQGISWDNLAERIAPELRIDALPEWVVREYREHFPAMTPVDVFYAATTAGRSWRGQVIEAEERAKAGAPAWVYQVDFASPIQPNRGAPHMQDIPLVFGTLEAAGSLTGTGADAVALSKKMMAAFARFVATGDPGADWPRYTLPDRATMVFDKVSQVENNPRQWERELFARIPYIQPGS